MISIEDGAARLALPKPAYTVDSLRMAALVVSGKAEAFLDEKRDRFVVELKAAEDLSDAELKKLAGEFLNEALTALYRQELIKAAPELAQAIMARVLEKGFPALPPDPLEQLEPQVKLDRDSEVEGLLSAARKMKA